MIMVDGIILVNNWSKNNQTVKKFLGLMLSFIWIRHGLAQSDHIERLLQYI